MKVKRRKPSCVLNRVGGGRFAPGISGNPGGIPANGRPRRIRSDAKRASPRALLEAALDTARATGDFDAFEHFVRRSRESDGVLVELMRKLVANKTQVVVGPEELDKVVATIVEVVARHVPATMLSLIVEELHSADIG